jgi:hypothetical protein
MRRRQAMGAMLTLMGAPALARALPAFAANNPATELFNGKDLTGWDTWLGKPHRRIDVPDFSKTAAGEYVGAIGLNRDPKNVFTVATVDGAPAIRISGEIFGAITSAQEFENYHLRFEFKWGQLKWPPREQPDRARDSGCLYHCVGPHGAGSGHWMQSLECQIQERDCGDFWSVARVMADVQGVPQNPDGLKTPNDYLIYKKGAPRVPATTRVQKDADHERPSGEWNTVDIYCVGQTSVHAINGSVNMMLTGIRRVVEGQEVPLTRGRIQFQSEGAEVFYRNIVVVPMRALPWTDD